MNDDGPRGSTVFCSGPPKAGKNHLLWRDYASKAPRLITLEYVRETHRLDPKAIEVYGYDQLVAQLHELAPKPRWHVIAFLSDDDAPRLFSLLAPLEIDGPESAGYSRSVGGVGVQCAELARVAPLGLAQDSPVKFAFLQYRHHWLSIFAATQRPADVNMAARTTDRSVFLKTAKKRDLGAIADLTTPGLAARVRDLPYRHSLTAIEARSEAYIADEHGQVYEVTDYAGVPLSGPGDDVPRSRGSLQPASRDARGRPAAMTELRRA